MAQRSRRVDERIVEQKVWSKSTPAIWEHPCTQSRAFLFPERFVLYTQVMRPRQRLSVGTALKSTSVHVPFV
eukprot:6817263-Prymnesium_polylepis.1